MDVAERMTPHNLFNDAVRDEFALAMHRYRLAVSLCAGKRVLDSGCGVGNGSFLLSAVAAQVTAIDAGNDAIAFAKKYYANTNLTFLVHDVLKPLSSQFDLIASFDVIEHVSHPDRYLQTLARELAPKGTLVISTPNKTVLQLIYPEHNPYHLHEMTLDEFKDAVRKYFSIKKIEGQQLVNSSAQTASDLDAARGFIIWCNSKNE